MKTTWGRLGVVAAMSLAARIGTAQEQTMSCAAHAAHQAAEPSAEHHAAVDERGDHEMGFDHRKTAHHFLLAEDGGSIQVTANDPGDQESTSQIRGHLTHIARMFGDGNFKTPMLVHDRVPPGVPEMTRLKSKIDWKFEELPGGARVVARTGDTDALTAIHAFLRFQIEDHRTGDPGTVERSVVRGNGTAESPKKPD